MAQITIEIQNEVLDIIEQVMSEQAERLAQLPEAQRPVGVPTDVSSWMRGVVEQAIAQFTLGRLNTTAIREAQARMEMAQREVVRAAAGVQAVRVQK